MKVYDALARALAAEGCATAFALLGDGNMLPLARFAEDPTHTLIQGRHENAVVAMADGYARATGGLALASVTDGPGLTQIPTSLTTAARHGTPMVVLTGDIATDTPFHAHHYPQQQLVASTGAGYLRVTAPGCVLDVTRQAFFLARRDHRPVVLSVPRDVQAAELADTSGYRPSSEFVVGEQPRPPAPDAMAELVDALVAAERPVIVAGRGAVHARAELAALGERTGALLGTTMKALGMFAGEPYAIGLVGGYSGRVVREYLAEADLVLAIGAQLGAHTTDAGRLFPNARRIQVDRAPSGLCEGRFAADAYVVGDARTVIAEVNERWPAGVANTGYRTGRVSGRLSESSDAPDGDTASAGLHPARAMAALDRSIDERTYVVIGGGHFWAFPLLGLTRLRPGRYSVECDFAAIGQGFGMALGAAVGRPELRIVCVEGDGSFLMHVQELETAARHGIDMAIVIMNDGAYGSEVHKLDGHGLDGRLTSYGRPPFERLAEAFGVSGRTITALDDLTDELDRHNRDGGVLVLDVHIDPSVISPPLRRTLGL